MDTKKKRMVEIGALLRKTRIEKGMTQSRLGIECGYKPKIGEVFVGQWENAVRPVPPAKYRAVAKALDLDLNDLVI